MSERTGWSRKTPLEQVGPLDLEPGKFVHGMLAADGVSIPLAAAAGTADGPVLYVQAIQHGLELNGGDVMRRLLEEVDPAQLAGTLILVPMANPLAARTRQQAYPEPDLPEARGTNDMNRRWFVEPAGNNDADHAVAALKPIVALADAVIDLHCHEYLYPPIAWTDVSHTRSRALGLAAGFPLMRTDCDPEKPNGHFGSYCRRELDIPALIIEMPPLGFIDRTSSTVGFKGVMNVMAALGLLNIPADRAPQTAVYGLPGEACASVIAEEEGLLVKYAVPGDAVTKGQRLAEIRCPKDFRPAQQIEAPIDGFLLRLGQAPRSWGGGVSDYIQAGETIADVRAASETVAFDETLR